MTNQKHHESKVASKKMTRLEMVLDVMMRAYRDSLTEKPNDPDVAFTSETIRFLIRKYHKLDLTVGAANGAIQTLRVREQIEKYGEIPNGHHAKYLWISTEVFEAEASRQATESDEKAKVMPSEPSKKKEPRGIEKVVQQMQVEIPAQQDSESEAPKVNMTRAERKRQRHGTPSPVQAITPNAEGMDLRELRREIHELKRDVSAINNSLGANFGENQRKVVDQQFQAVAEVKDQKERMNDIARAMLELKNAIMRLVNVEDQRDRDMLEIFDKSQENAEKGYSSGFRDGWDMFSQVANKLGVKPSEIPSSAEIKLDTKNGGKVEIDFGKEGVEANNLKQVKPFPKQVTVKATPFADAFEEDKEAKIVGRVVTGDPKTLPDWALNGFMATVKRFGETEGALQQAFLIHSILEVEARTYDNGRKVVVIYFRTNDKPFEMEVVTKRNSEDSIAKFREMFVKK